MLEFQCAEVSFRGTGLSAVGELLIKEAVSQARGELKRSRGE